MMKILIAGSSGLVGIRLVTFLRNLNHTVERLVRNPKDNSDDTILWALDSPMKDPTLLENFDVVINLAGENISSGRWTDEKKAKILKSRVQATEQISKALAQLKNPPKLLLNASATGYYGNRGDELLTEESSSGTGFLADVCKKWEAATQPAEQKGIRTVHLRFGVILSPDGGALAKMLPLFKLGLGGPLGSGKQYMSWIELSELMHIINFVLQNPSISGAINVVSPNPVTNYEFTKTLGKSLSRPTIFTAPAFVLKFLLGEMADELLLSSTRAIPNKLQESGYSFRFPTLEGTLRQLWKKTK